MGVVVPLGPVLEASLDQCLRVMTPNMVILSKSVNRKCRATRKIIISLNYSPSHHHLGSLVAGQPASPCGQDYILYKHDHFDIDNEVKM